MRVTKLHVAADLLDMDDDLYLSAAETGMISFQLPAEGKMLRMSVGSVSLYVDAGGRMLLDAPQS